MMKALVYGGPGQRSWRDVPLPELQDPEDAIIRVDAVTICGTDLHILKGDVPEVEPGRILGHEAVGTIARGRATASATSPRRPGPVSCISGCGRCRYCREGATGSASAAAAGSSATSSTACRRNSSGCPFADLSPARSRTPSPTRPR